MFHPPYGLFNDITHNVVNELGLRMVLWKVASWDWMHETEVDQIVGNVVKNVSKGDIILLHELPHL
jgi:peptidoglycan/xylan/chitin deacetylase (PgdA/CDA1 family)